MNQKCEYWVPLVFIHFDEPVLTCSSSLLSVIVLDSEQAIWT